MDFAYISIYDSAEVDFSHNGTEVLLPLSCEITETLNSEYALTLIHPYDKWGKWKSIVEWRILKVQGQLFRIYRKVRTMSADGSYSITAYARHISYDLNNYFIYDTRPTQLLPRAALDWITTPSHSGTQNIMNGDPKSKFEFSTTVMLDPDDPDSYRTAYYERMSVTKALMGADNSFINNWGGEVERDNYRFKILKRRGSENAFNIRYGVDMTDIQEDVDLSSYYQSLYYEGIVYSEATSSDHDKTRKELSFTGKVNQAALSIMQVQPMGHYRFELNANDIADIPGVPTVENIKKECGKRALRYLLSECQPQITYSVKFADLRNTEMYKDFVNLQKCELGDSGTIYHEGLGIETTQRIVKKTIDGITGETISIDLGSIKKTLTSRIANGGQ